ncbi:MAG TPA: DEAD/DEAH box helicase [Thermoanaerobaculia bacterium]|nr:DEAD/DEAH box helicase [Thermoanaerobaculia bacterium]
MRTLRDASLLAEHQLRAVEDLVPLLDRYGGAILADEPGLGKSFVAAEVARREAARGAVIEAVVPASLVDQWRETFRRFRVAAEVMTHVGLLRAEEPPAARRLLIADEAHAFRNPGTQRYAALARRSAGARLLLVTATPVCNSARDLEALLRLAVCDDALMKLGVPSIDLAFATRDRGALGAVVSELVIRRDRSVLPPPLAFGDLDRRVIRTPPAGEEVLRRIAALRFPLAGGEELVRDFLLRRLESSEAALLESLRRQRRFYERALECLAAGRALPKREYRRAFAHEEDAPSFQTILFWELFVGEERHADAGEIRLAMKSIEELREVVERLPREKERVLLGLCSTISEPVLLFTGWTATARALAAVLQRVRRTVLVTGRERSNAASIEAFRRGAADILVSTDLGAEGLNLQRAGAVIHYDLPWNPVRIDQRNGRAHRIGQRRESVRAIYFLPDRHRGAVLQKIVAKNRTRRRLLGAAAGSRVEPCHPPTLRPRVAAGSAVVSFAAAAARAGWRVPAPLERRQRAGLELLLGELGGGPLDERGIGRIERWLALEPWAASRDCRFRHL